MVKFLVLFILNIFILNGHAQESKKTEAKANEAKAVEEVVSEIVEEETTEEERITQEFEQIKYERLQRIRDELINLNSKIRTVKKKLRNSDIDMVSKIQADSQLNAYEKEYLKKRFQFIETATEINLNQDEKKTQKTDFLNDIQQILAPAMNSIKQISERPRQVQELKEKSDSIENRFHDAKEALARLESQFKENTIKNLNRKYKESIKATKELVKELKIKRDDLKFKIIKIEKDQEPFISTFSNVILDFFKTKGLNLFLALVIFISVFWAFRAAQPKIISIILYRINKSDKKEMYSWVVTPIRVIYSVFSTVFAFLLGILTLYALNDWVLVTFILFTLAALVWSSKHYLPVFLEHSKIVLNLGAIREGERVIYGGIPWQIKSLGYYCHLYNPVLSGGFLRVNTRELLTINSRRIINNEPWFPTKTGDWVEVNSLFGQVTLQSPEIVVLKHLGEEKSTFKASEFVQMAPVNLSNGFGIEIIFGLDYQHQGQMFSEVIPQIEKDLAEIINHKHEKMKDSMGDLSIEFQSAGASSLDLRFFLKCQGDIAGKKRFLTRSIQTELVKLCNKYHYVIPFNQLTVHMEKHESH